jgi:prepilin-type processing-associated H-X9-DG protein
MLVVMAIIATLAGLLIPAIFSSREQGRRAKCTSNLTQISQAIAIYCNNSNDYLPSWLNYGDVVEGIHYGDVVEGIQRGGPGGPEKTFAGHQGPSRHMVVGYSFETDDPAADLLPMVWPERRTVVIDGKDVEIMGPLRHNFAPNGLGLLIHLDCLDDPNVFNCPSMKGEVDTYYGFSSNAGDNRGNRYVFDPAAWKKLAVKGKDIFAGDGRSLHHTPVDAFDTSGPTVTALLSSYSYRDTPFYYQVDDYDKDHPLVLDSLKPALKPEFMVPLFKTRRTLGDRAIVSDTFDYAQPDKADWFSAGKGLGKYVHGSGYNVLYGDGHAAWFEDDDNKISNWRDTDPAHPNWLDPAHAGTDNLTISSPTSQKVWNLFDRAAGIDVK